MKKTEINLIPATENRSPDYYCTWQSQLYASSDAGPQGQRDHMTERDIFGSGERESDFREGIGWATHLYPDARRDLYLILDDSWDVPIGDNHDESPFYGSLLLARDKFPSAYGLDSAELNGVEPYPSEGEFDLDDGDEAMKKLAERVESLGWRGLGGWVCLEKSPLAREKDDDSYWRERLVRAQRNGWRYWKVDWGRDCGSIEARRRLNRLRDESAPGFIVEQAMLPGIIGESDVFRSYDAFTLMAYPLTLERLSQFLMYETKPGCGGIVNCEDEPYIAAALGCALGVMRHGMVGSLPNGKPDCSFPAMHRDFKSKLAEVTRCVRWHRIAPAFGVKASETHIDANRLTDDWRVVSRESEIEAWWKYVDGDLIEKSAPARISRRVALPEVTPDASGYVPYVIASSGSPEVASVATLGRTHEREYFVPRCDVTLEAGKANTIGIFGYYATLTVKSEAMKVGSRVLMQDLAGDCAYDVTERCEISDGALKLPGELIARVGTEANPNGDTSEPGVVVRIG